MIEVMEMTELARERCEACSPDAPRLGHQEIEALLRQLPGWRIVERERVPRLERAYRFENFAAALAFTNRVGAIAEQEGHHPAILTEWGRVTVTWWTHAIGGLHRNDFVMAAKTDAALSRRSAA